ncbi:DNA-binding response regulator [Slackia equolifaciens]|uniref:DNA-binding response regulator n=1 Tax=Slackia equolifaciens TaxID=498718 RepID=A0A3N0AYX8_9ACTN|nr:response regulator transcription factor [Slackia equolifaciens]RNL39556.1 DNA-binding response regulator [Slackia equolifaciens]HJF64544.1 response regulator transcription factor [Slackia equolifaciens]
MRILLVDDESSIKRLVSDLVSDAGYDFSYAEDGLEALSIVERENVDLIIMDVMMPHLDGFSTCREIRSRGLTVPIIFLSAKGDIVDKGIGFQAGGDDYMVKPFDPRELMMHVEAHLRRTQMASIDARPKSETISIGRFVINLKQYRVSKDGQPVKLTLKEFKIFSALAENPGVVLSKDELIERAWGKEFVGETSSITVFIKKLRSKIEDDPSDPHIIQTVWGVGYRLEPEAC